MEIITTVTSQMVLAFTGYIIVENKIDNRNKILYSFVKEYLALDLLILDSKIYILLFIKLRDELYV